MVIYLSLFKGITLFCLSMLPSSAYFPKPLVKPVNLAVLQANSYSSVCYMSCGSLYAWPRLTEPKVLSGFQIQILAHSRTGREGKYCTETCESQAAGQTSGKLNQSVCCGTLKASWNSMQLSMELDYL